MKLHWKEAKEQLTIDNWKKGIKITVIGWLIWEVVGTIVYFIKG